MFVTVRSTNVGAEIVPMLGYTDEKSAVDFARNFSQNKSKFISLWIVCGPRPEFLCAFFNGSEHDLTSQDFSRHSSRARLYFNDQAPVSLDNAQLAVAQFLNVNRAEILEALKIAAKHGGNCEAAGNIYNAVATELTDVLDTWSKASQAFLESVHAKGGR